MRAISEYRRQLGLVAAAAMQIKTELVDVTAEYAEKLDNLQKQADELYLKIDEALDG